MKNLNPLEKQIIEKYKKGDSMTSISGTLRVSMKYVREVLEKNGFKIRHRKRWETRRNKCLIHIKFAELFETHPEWLMEVIKNRKSKEDVVKALMNYLGVGRQFIFKHYSKAVDKLIKQKEKELKRIERKIERIEKRKNKDICTI